MRKELRNTITAYLLFIYGITLLPLFLISFKSEAYGVNLYLVFAFAFMAALTDSMLFYNSKINMRYFSRVFIFWGLLTLVDFFIWLFICNGTFILRE